MQECITQHIFRCDIALPAWSVLTLELPYPSADPVKVLDGGPRVANLCPVFPSQRCKNGKLLVALPEETVPGHDRTLQVIAADDRRCENTLVHAEEFDCPSGQEYIRVETATGSWVFHKRGGGFASLIDLEGNDWISHCPEQGPHGRYRGIPNLAYPESLFHPGCDGCESQLVETGPVRATILSRSCDGAWETRWEIYPLHARLHVLKTAHPYWVLYEGTPGGQLDTAFQIIHRSDGWSGPVGQGWSTNLSPPAWVAFADPPSHRQFFLIRHNDDGAGDLYWPMEESMTVFGFGRNDDARQPVGTLIQTPAVFDSGLCEGSGWEAANKAVKGILEVPGVKHCPPD